MFTFLLGTWLQIGVRVRLFKPSAYAFDYHISHQSRTDSLFFNWSATGRSEGSKNTPELKFKSGTHQSISYSYPALKVRLLTYLIPGP